MRAQGGISLTGCPSNRQQLSRLSAIGRKSLNGTVPELLLHGNVEYGLDRSCLISRTGTISEDKHYLIVASVSQREASRCMIAEIIRVQWKALRRVTLISMYVRDFGDDRTVVIAEFDI